MAAKKKIRRPKKLWKVNAHKIERVRRTFRHHWMSVDSSDDGPFTFSAEYQYNEEYWDAIFFPFLHVAVIVQRQIFDGE